METQPEYIQVLTPLKLETALTYRVPASLQGRTGPGTRVKVRVGGRLTDAVVTRTGVTPDIAPERIREIEGLADGLERITPEEIRLWEFIADYYLCTEGEVFRCAYPSGKIRSEETAARSRERAEASRQKMHAAALLRINKLEAEMAEVEARTAAALASLSERSVKTRQKLIEKREERLARLRQTLESARALAEGMAEAGPEVKGHASTTGMTDCRKAPKEGPDPDALALKKALDGGKPVLLQADAAQRLACYGALIRDTLAQGRSVLMMVPEIALTESFEADMRRSFGDRALVFHSRETTAFRRKVADALRESGPHLLIGTRSALFLPYHSLSLILVDEEQDRSYKQDSPAPRYNARDCAVVLAGIHQARILLGSRTPSLESLYNCLSGRYRLISLPDATPSQTPQSSLKLIDTVAEYRKHGMCGQFSRKLIEEMRKTLAAGREVCLIRLWGETESTVKEAQALFPDTEVVEMETPEQPPCIRVGTLARTKHLTFAEGSLAVLLQADPILGERNFRADERAFQLLDHYRRNCAAGTFVIQTGRSAHPVFQALLAGRDPWTELLEERKAFNFPPYSRIVDIVLRDTNEKRLSLMGRALSERLTVTLRPEPGLGAPVRLEGPFPSAPESLTLRVILAKDRRFPLRKHSLREAVDAFVKERKYIGFIHLDVDPE